MVKKAPNLVTLSATLPSLDPRYIDVDNKGIIFIKAENAIFFTFERAKSEWRKKSSNSFDFCFHLVRY